MLRRALLRQTREVHSPTNYAGIVSTKQPGHLRHWLEANTGNHFRYWDRMGPEDVDHAQRLKAQGTWFQSLRWGDYIVVHRAKETEEMLDHGVFMGHDRGICTYTVYKDPEKRGTFWLGRNLMIWLSPDLFALEDDDIYVNDLLVYSPDPEKELGMPLAS